jgi:GAF domain-containing protein
MASQLMSSSEVLRLNRSLRLLNECAAALIHTEDEHALLTEICRLCVESGGYMMAWIGIPEQDAAKTVHPITQFGCETGYLQQIHISWADDQYGQGPTGSAIRLKKTVVNQNILTNPTMRPWRAAAQQRGYQASIALPLMDKKQVLSVLTLYAAQADAFHPDEVTLLESLANERAILTHAS